MNPNSSQPGFELPPPITSGGETNAGKDERRPAQIEKAPTTKAPAGKPTSVPAPFPVNNPKTSDDNQATTTPMAADDNDLIEKEWVLKAKQIVAATKDDPHKQNREISRFKADYLKKRYNKDIKVEDL